MNSRLLKNFGIKTWDLRLRQGVQNMSVAAKKISINRKNWESVVGLEVHAQIKTNSKLFSGTAAKYGAPVNTLVSLFDCAIPGTLPVINRKCVESGVLTALALNCHVNLTSEFDRKHYFYADMPAGYQITQQRLPLASNGHLEFVVFNRVLHKVPYRKKSMIKQLQLEQDSGKSLHDDLAEGSLIDLNRVGVGLMEIVFEPDLSGGEEAAALVSELIGVLDSLGTCNCKMEEGSLRVDANVSVNKPGQPLGTRTEIKNLNSMRAVARAIEYEIDRQIQILEHGGIVENETRGYDSQVKETRSMRDKEAKQDYRYMPEPNLPPLRLKKMNLNPSDYHRRIPILPDQKRQLLMERYQLNLETAVQLVNGGSIQFFNAVMEAHPHLPAKRVVNLLLTDLLGLLNKEEKNIQQCPVSPKQFADIIELRISGLISHLSCQNILVRIYEGDLRSPKTIMEEEGWALVTDVKQMEIVCEQVILNNEKMVALYRKGKSKLLSKLSDELLLASKSKFDMAVAVPILKKLLDKK